MLRHRLKQAGAFILAGFFLGWMGMTAASISEPDHVLYGAVTLDGTPVFSGRLALFIEAWDGAIAEYQLGSEPGLGTSYALRVPMNSVGQRLLGTARDGDEALVFLGGELVGKVLIGERGTAQRVDLDPAFVRAVGLQINDIEVDEAAAGQTSTAVFTVSLAEPRDDAVEFSWRTEDGEGGQAAFGGSSCGGGADFIADDGVGTIAPGNLNTTIGVIVCGNDVADGDRIFFVELFNPSSGVGLLKPKGQATIRDNDTLPLLSIADVTILEPPTGQNRPAVFRLDLSRPWHQPVSVSWATRNGSALAGLDYVGNSGTVQFAPGQQSRQVEVSVLANPAALGSRDFFVDLSNSQQATLGRTPARGLIIDGAQTLVQVEVQKDGENGVSGMSDPVSVTVASPEGAHVYVASRTADEIVVFARNAETGRLQAQQFTSLGALMASAGERNIPGIDGFTDLAVSPDGRHLYAVSQNNAIVSFQRNNSQASPDFGRLAFEQLLRNGDEPNPELTPSVVAGLLDPRAVAVSADGENVYVAAAGGPGHVVTFTRNGDNGRLRFREQVAQGAQDPGNALVQGIAGASALAVAAGDGQVYVTGQSSNSVAVFRRNMNANGGLRFVQHLTSEIGANQGFRAPSGVAVSGDGGQVYVSGQDSNAVAVFDRAAADGRLTWRSAIVGGQNNVDGLRRPQALAVSPDGSLVYVVSDEDHAGQSVDDEPGTLTVLRRVSDPDATDFGALRFEEIKRNKVGGVTGLWGASGISVSPDNAHVYVTARFDRSVAVFARDLLPPLNPSLISASHTVGTWSNRRVIEMQWSGAVDLDASGENTGSGVAGYAVLFSTDPDSVPAAVINVAHASDPHSISSDVLPDGDSYYFHLRTCDNAGNCSEPVTAGPYLIDGTAPQGPSNLASSSHQAGLPPIAETVIDMSWSAAVDPGPVSSGLAGYSFLFSRNASDQPNLTLNLPADRTTVSSEQLSDGSWYFHLRALDVAGNAGPVQTAGPFRIGLDASPPQVFAVSTVAAPAGDELVSGAELNKAITQILIRFNKPMDAARAADVDNFRLVSGQLGSAGSVCDQPDQGRLQAAEYIGAENLSVLRVADFDLGQFQLGPQDVGLPAGDYTLVACDRLRDFNNNPLDGNASGTSGGAFLLPFTVLQTNRLPNPNFDRGFAADNWSLSDASSITLSAGVDAGGAPSSGSARLAANTGGASAYALTRCVQIDPNLSSGFGLTARARIAATGGGDPSNVSATASMAFHEGSVCGSEREGFVSNAVLNDTAGAWVPLSVSVSAGAIDGRGSVLISLDVEFDQAAFPVNVWFDDVSFFTFDEGEVSTDPPAVAAVWTTRHSGGAGLHRLPRTDASITQLIPEFSRGVRTVPGGTGLGAESAANSLQNYRLFVMTEDRGNPDCSSAEGDISFAGASYDASTNRTVLRIGGGQALPAGHYRLAVCGTIRDFNDRPLAGDGSSEPGTDYLLDFEVFSTNLLRNPNLDVVLAPWQVDFSPTAGNNLRWSSADRDGRLSSGAVRIIHATGIGSSYRLSQCVDLQDFTEELTLEAAVLTNQGFGPAPVVGMLAVFHADSDCGGAELGTLARSAPMAHSAGRWINLVERLPVAPEGAGSAQVRFEVVSGVGEDAPFDLWLDNLGLRAGWGDLIFKSRFEP